MSSTEKLLPQDKGLSNRPSFEALLKVIQEPLTIPLLTALLNYSEEEVRQELTKLGLLDKPLSLEQQLVFTQNHGIADSIQTGNGPENRKGFNSMAVDHVKQRISANDTMPRYGIVESVDEIITRWNDPERLKANTYIININYDDFLDSLRS